MKELTIEAVTPNISIVTDFVNEILEEHDCSPKVQMQIELAIDELFTNVSSYAYPSGTGSVTVCVDFEEETQSVVITMIDQGCPYNPLEAKEPDLTLSLEERPIGGLGIFLVRKVMDEVTYEYRNGQNIVCLRKKLV